MSKYVKDFCSKAQQTTNLSEKLKASYILGSRVLPSKTAKNDADYQMRIDAGELVGTLQNLYL